jgi:hypothetical protein
VQVYQFPSELLEVQEMVLSPLLLLDLPGHVRSHQVMEASSSAQQLHKLAL